jgi:hypothetical protein
VLGEPGAQIVDELMLGAAGIQAETHRFCKFQQIGERGVLQVVD